MSWALAARFLITPAIITFLSGARVAKWLLIAEGILLLVVIVALTAACFGSKGVGIVALVATLKGLIYVLPMAVLGASGILVGLGLRKAAGLPANGSAFGMTRRP